MCDIGRFHESDAECDGRFNMHLKFVLIPGVNGYRITKDAYSYQVETTE